MSATNFYSPSRSGAVNEAKKTYGIGSSLDVYVPGTVYDPNMPLPPPEKACQVASTKEALAVAGVVCLALAAVFALPLVWLAAEVLGPRLAGKLYRKAVDKRSSNAAGETYVAV